MNNLRKVSSRAWWTVICVIALVVSASGQPPGPSSCDTNCAANLYEHDGWGTFFRVSNNNLACLKYWKVLGDDPTHPQGDIELHDTFVLWEPMCFTVCDPAVGGEAAYCVWAADEDEFLTEACYHDAQDPDSLGQCVP